VMLLRLLHFRLATARRRLQLHAPSRVRRRLRERGTIGAIHAGLPPDLNPSDLAPCLDTCRTLHWAPTQTQYAHEDRETGQAVPSRKAGKIQARAMGPERYL